jgi:uridine phosphorylase
VRHLRLAGWASRDPYWACYHTELYDFDHDGRTFGIVGCAVGASFAVLIAEQLFASGCRLLISVASSGQILSQGAPPYFVLIERALRDEGTSHHYLPPSDYACLSPALRELLEGGFSSVGVPVHVGATWTTDAPFRETGVAIEAARREGILAVEMEAAALYAFAEARKRPVICLAHVTNQMGTVEGDFEKGEANGTRDALQVVAAAARSSASFWSADGGAADTKG